MYICSAAGFRPSSVKFDLFLVANGYLTILLHPHFLRRSDNSTSHLNKDPKTARFISIFHGWKMFQPNLKSKLLQPFSVATLLLKHVLFLQLSLFIPQQKCVLPAHHQNNVIYQFLCHCNTLQDHIKQHVPRLIRNHHSS